MITACLLPSGWQRLRTAFSRWARCCVCLLYTSGRTAVLCFGIRFRCGRCPGLTVQDGRAVSYTHLAADLLILDDLGTEFFTPYFITTVYSLLNNRLGAGLPTIVTTNIADGSLLEKRYKMFIRDRCHGHGTGHCADDGVLAALVVLVEVTGQCRCV